MVDDVILEERCQRCSPTTGVKKSRAQQSREKAEASTVAIVDERFEQILKAIDDASARGELYLYHRSGFLTHEQFLKVKQMLQVEGYNVVSNDKRENNMYEILISW